MATGACEGWKLVFAEGSLAHNIILPYFLDIKDINERDPQIVIECGTMGLQYNKNMAGGLLRQPTPMLVTLYPDWT